MYQLKLKFILQQYRALPQKITIPPENQSLILSGESTEFPY